MTKVGEIMVEALLEDAKFQQGIGKMVDGLEKTKRKSKDLNTYLKEMGSILNTLAVGATAFGAGIIASLTGALAASPHFKAFLAGLKGPFMKLSQFMGSQLNPALQALLRFAKDLIDTFISNESVRNFFDKWGKNLGDFLDSISREDVSNFMELAAGIADKTLTYTFNLAGTAYDLLLGDNGILTRLNKMTDSFTLKIGGFTIPNDAKAFAVLSAVSLASGHPWIAGILGAYAVGTTLQNTLGAPESFKTNNPGVWEATSGGATGTFLDAFTPQAGMRAGAVAAREVVIILENKTGVDMTAQKNAANTVLEWI